MNKQLLDQVQQALTAQQHTIQRQEQMLNDKDSYIVELESLLKQLTTTQTEQLQHLPKLHDSLKNTINEQKKAYRSWIKERKTLLELMNKLINDSIALCNAQNRLTELMKQYQSTIALQSSLSSNTEQLESELDELANSQKKIMDRQNSLSEQQQNLLKLLQE